MSAAREACNGARAEQALRRLIGLCHGNAAAREALRAQGAALVPLLRGQDEIVVMRTLCLMSNLVVADKDESTEESVEFLCTDEAMFAFEELLNNTDNLDVLEKLIWLITDLTLRKVSSAQLTRHNIFRCVVDLVFDYRSNAEFLCIISEPLKNMLNSSLCDLFVENQRVFCQKKALDLVLQLLQGENSKMVLNAVTILDLLTESGGTSRRLRDCTGLTHLF
eukprot:TRINITY_DN147_c0_g1_i3.p1 TRINITY_DN147_c0_g1~~TRINITY_DN147_c0_g1_i3.p1  ORF type:complete len:222 (+),score=58.17 TRINITY_DN147_c0_g1_i3:43-708(+)